jgi:hypothetical protein
MGSLQYEKTDRGTFLFHKEIAPKGQKMSSVRAKEMEGKDGWVDSPAKFGVVSAAAAATPMAAVEIAVRNEKQLFADSVVSSVKNGVYAEFNDVYEQFTIADLKDLVQRTGFMDPAALPKTVAAARTAVKQLIKGYNDNLGE